MIPDQTDKGNAWQVTKLTHTHTYVYTNVGLSVGLLRLALGVHTWVKMYRWGDPSSDRYKCKYRGRGVVTLFLYQASASFRLRAETSSNWLFTSFTTCFMSNSLLLSISTTTEVSFSCSFSSRTSCSEREACNQRAMHGELQNRWCATEN